MLAPSDTTAQPSKNFSFVVLLSLRRQCHGIIKARGSKEGVPQEQWGSAKRDGAWPVVAGGCVWLGEAGGARPALWSPWTGVHAPRRSAGGQRDRAHPRATLGSCRDGHPTLILLSRCIHSGSSIPRHKLETPCNLLEGRSQGKELSLPGT